ncbi:MAG: DNA-binding Lrp family transcriptional regulator [Urechidicola sp.]|jgi:Lrp/AsnC family transcriptional regulator|tara:strand:- start:7908 stop:8369 length:462 start_codon:yes stop_codon:yes gene_type:complete
MKLDTIDRQLLALLQSDSKMNIKEIASKLNISKTPIYERIKKLEKSGVIDKYVAILDRKKIVTPMVVFCSVSLDSQKLKEIKDFSASILKVPEVMECYLMSGSNDFLLKVVVKNLNDYHLFSSVKLAALPNVAQIKSTFVLDEIKRATVLPIY